MENHERKTRNGKSDSGKTKLTILSSLDWFPDSQAVIDNQQKKPVCNTCLSLSIWYFLLPTFYLFKVAWYTRFIFISRFALLIFTYFCHPDFCLLDGIWEISFCGFFGSECFVILFRPSGNEAAGQVEGSSALYERIRGVDGEGDEDHDTAGVNRNRRKSSTTISLVRRESSRLQNFIRKKITHVWSLHR